MEAILNIPWIKFCSAEFWLAANSVTAGDSGWVELGQSHIYTTSTCNVVFAVPTKAGINLEQQNL